MNKKNKRSPIIWLILLSLAFAVSPAYAGAPPATGPGTPQPASSGPQPSAEPDTQLKNFDCSKVTADGIDKQLNMRAGLIRINCGLDSPASLQMSNGSSGALASVTNIGGTDVQVNDALADTFPHVTQSTSAFAAHGDTVIAAYVSSTDAPGNYSGYSYSIDGGSTFTETLPSPFATGHGTNYGDPQVLYSSYAGKFYSFWLATGCGGQGVGMWSSSNGISWSVGSCAISSTAGDRTEAWVDNNPASPYYGRIYVSFNDFSVSGGALELVYSIDNGLTWTAPVVLNASFIRNVMGVARSDGKAFLAAMNEGGGGLNPRQNWLYTSTDGGATWSGAAMGSAFPAPGDTSCGGYFVAIAPIWRYMGWGSLGIGQDGSLLYAYTAGSVGDIGNIFFTRSADSGATWSVPIRLNTDAGTRAQWMPSLSVTGQGTVVVAWYDRRNTSNNDYQRYARLSLDGGVTWKTDQPMSDQVIPQPAQPDPNLTACYAGDYNRNATSGNTAIGGWTDGRVSINATAQQDVYADRVTAAPLPTCVTGSDSWQLDASLPTDVYGAAVASDGNYIYAAGGYSFSATGDVTNFARFSVRANTWTSLAPLPVAVNEAMGVYLSGKIYVFGGEITNSGTVLDATQIYDVASNTWQSGPSMPAPRAFMGGGAYNGKIYLAGGYSTGNVDPSYSQLWSFDPGSGNFSVLAPMPASLGGPASAIINGKLYIAGGRDLNHPALNTLYEYNFATASWSTLAPLPTPVNVAGGAALDGKMWVMGGGTPFMMQLSTPGIPSKSAAPETMSTVQIYDPTSNTWAAGPPQLVSRSFQKAGVASGTIISVGGYNGANTSAVTESFLRQRLSILLLSSDITFSGAIRDQLRTLPGVGKVDTFDESKGLPTLAQLQQYDMVTTWSNYPYVNPTVLGDELADYVDGGGVVVELAFDFYSGFELAGRWVTGNYSAFNSGSANFSYASLGSVLKPGNPLMVGVSNITAFYRLSVTTTAGAVTVANWSDATPLLAFKGHVVSVSGYFGDVTPAWTGNIGQVLSNAGFSMRKPNTACYINSVYLPMVRK